jgi:hypothetical protein
MALDFNTMMTVAIENRSSKITDVLTKSNALLNVLRDHGGVKTFDGGRTITENIMYAEPGLNAQSYSGYDTLNTLTGEHLTMAEFSIAQYASSVSVSGLELAQNSGKSKMIDLVESRVRAAEAALTNKISSDLYGDGTTANSLTGIQAMLPAVATTGVYGGIDRATYTFWRHQTRTGTAITNANIYAKYLELFLSLGRNSTESPDAILACKDHFFALSTAMQAQQRFEQVGSEKYTNMGFQNLMFMNCPVFLERNAFGASGMISNGSYFINTDTVKLRPFKSDKFVHFDGTPTTQDASVKRLKYYANLTCSNVALNGVLIG